MTQLLLWVWMFPWCSSGGAGLFFWFLETQEQKGDQRVLLAVVPFLAANLAYLPLPMTSAQCRPMSWVFVPHEGDRPCHFKSCWHPFLTAGSKMGWDTVGELEVTLCSGWPLRNCTLPHLKVLAPSSSLLLCWLCHPNLRGLSYCLWVKCIVADATINFYIMFDGSFW